MVTSLSMRSNQTSKNASQQELRDLLSKSPAAHRFLTLFKTPLDKFVGNILEDAQRMERLVARLLELARLEAVSRERWTHFRAFVPTRENPAGIFDRAAIDAGIERSLAAERQ